VWWKSGLKLGFRFGCLGLGCLGLGVGWVGLGWVGLGRGEERTDLRLEVMLRGRRHLRVTSSLSA